jgi:hypothetical protein
MSTSLSMMAKLNVLVKKTKPFSRFTWQSGSHSNKQILSGNAYKLKDI